MKSDQTLLVRLLSWVVMLLVPVALLLTSVRILLTPAFLQIEYRTPNFPPDSYGFTREDRLKWGGLALDYLLNDEDVSFLGDLTFEDGSSLYNPRELSHMLDVKVLTQQVLWVWYGVLAVLLVLGVWAWRGAWLSSYRQMLAGGGKLTIGLLALLIFFALLSFNQLFVGFHRIFFEGDSWLFLYSDTLIRLFPLRFWRDAFILIGLLPLLGGGALWYFLGRGAKS